MRRRKASMVTERKMKAPTERKMSMLGQNAK